MDLYLHQGLTGKVHLEKVVEKEGVFFFPATHHLATVLSWSPFSCIAILAYTVLQVTTLPYSWVIPMPPMTAVAKAFLFICILSAALLYDTNHGFLFVLSLLNTVLYFWSLGTMDNFAREKYRDLRVEQMKHLPEWMAETARHGAKDAVPNWLATINFLCTFLSVGLLSYGIFVHV